MTPGGKYDVKSMTIDLTSVNKSGAAIAEDEENLPANNSGRATSHRDIP